MVLGALLAATGSAQVFVVGEKTAEADVVTDFHPTHVEIPSAPLTERGHLDLIRNLEAEQGFAHRQLPMGVGLTLIANGHLSLGIDEYKHMLYTKGQAAGPGDRVEISSLEFKGDRLVIDFNGGPYAKHRFLSHISINDMQLARRGPDAVGCRITLVFEGGLPEISAAEVKALLDPLIDFHAKSSAEAYTNTLKPMIKSAVEAHQILVGMDVRMVLAAVGEPHTKDREHVTPGDSESPWYEEWIYGQPPQATQFVRFRGGRVVRLEIAALGKPIEIHDKPEIGPTEEDPTLHTRTIANGDVPVGGDTDHRAAPTLRKPGEVLETPNTVGRVNIPASSLPPGATPAPSSAPTTGSSTTPAKQLGSSPTL
ncbi:MAG: hypothetical protein V4555_11150 [Acidobacteriota bacterium]